MIRPCRRPADCALVPQRRRRAVRRPPLPATLIVRVGRVPHEQGPELAPVDSFVASVSFTAGASRFDETKQTSSVRLTVSIRGGEDALHKKRKKTTTEKKKKKTRWSWTIP